VANRPASTSRRPQSLGNLLEQSRELQTPAGQVSLQTWADAVGERIALRSRPERVTKGVLWVRVPSSTWAQELSLHAETIAGRLRERGIAVEGLRFRVGLEVTHTPSAARKAPAVRRSELPQELRQRIEKIDDPELRGAIEDAAAFSLGRGR
jgi:hypothetical protein